MTTGEAARRKGQQFQLEIATRLAADGFHVQNIGSGVTGCDMVARKNGTSYYIETKFQERAKLREWWRQANANCPDDAVPVLAIKQSRQPVLWVTSEPPQ